MRCYRFQAGRRPIGLSTPGPWHVCVTDRGSGSCPTCVDMPTAAPSADPGRCRVALAPLLPRNLLQQPPHHRAVGRVVHDRIVPQLSPTKRNYSSQSKAGTGSRASPSTTPRPPRVGRRHEHDRAATRRWLAVFRGGRSRHPWRCCVHCTGWCRATTSKLLRIRTASGVGLRSVAPHRARTGDQRGLGGSQGGLGGFQGGLGILRDQGTS